MTHLNDYDFDQMDPSSIWIVAFYVPQCSHTEAFAPKLEAAAHDLQNHGYNIKLGAVNVEDNKELGWKYQVGESPSVKIFYHANEGGWVDTDYVGEAEQ